MQLVIQSQDIRALELGLSKEGRLVELASFSVSPEEHLKTLTYFLENHGVTVKDIQSIFIVTGPGSFTASRVSITIANTLAFTLDIPVYATENKSDLTLATLLEQGIEPRDFAIPFYDRAPFVTTSQRASGSASKSDK